MKYYASSDIGKVRNNNEDTVFASNIEVGTLPNLFVVADGMGGYNGGEYASSHALSEALKSIKKSNKINIAEILEDAIKMANRKIVSVSKKKPEYAGMGTTFVIATIVGSKLYVANIGDSRLYVIRKKIQQVTKDHSYIQALIDEGVDVSSKEIAKQKNVITRAIGTEDKVKADFYEVSLKPGDLVLMCSDGLTNMVSDEDIFNIIKGESDTEDMVRSLMIESKKNGGHDNISIIVIDPDFER